MSPRLARTASEAYPYTARQPCEDCGTTGFVPDGSASEIPDDVLTRQRFDVERLRGTLTEVRAARRSFAD
ncbi:hypothetical protein [Actinomadura atramentaria]|uniref:hypothetical protein n=1 Tax=Actinomadura atramentaria TaxID=1990 RepID=UPI00035DF01C|nr:hypothetical protein [Actinomadura atramentaria]